MTTTATAIAQPAAESLDGALAALAAALFQLHHRLPLADPRRPVLAALANQGSEWVVRHAQRARSEDVQLTSAFHRLTGQIALTEAHSFAGVNAVISQARDLIGALTTMADLSLFTKQLDQIGALIDEGQVEQSTTFLIGQLTGLRASEHWPAIVATLRAHPLHQTLLSDPLSAQAFNKVRGFAGDASIIDIMYDRTPPVAPVGAGGRIFALVDGFQSSEGVRARRAVAAKRLNATLEAGSRVLALACGHFREADGIDPRDLAAVTLVDQDPIALEHVRNRFGDGPTVIEANVIRFLRKAAAEGQQWDYVYTLGLTDYFEDRVMDLFAQLLQRVVAPGGVAMVANVVPEHLATGWMEAVMDWHLVLRDEAALEEFGRRAGFARVNSWRDHTRSIAFCDYFQEGEPR